MNTKMKMALMAGVLSLSVVGQANAAIVNNGTYANNLVLSVWDQTNLTSYTANLGTTMASMLTGITFVGTSTAPVISGSSTATGFTFSDAALTSFLATASANTTWSVSAVNMNVLGYGTAGVMTTSVAVPAVQNSATLAASSNFGLNYVSTVNTLMGAGTSITTTSATGGLAYVGTGTGTNLNSGLSFSNQASIGQSEGFYFFTPTANSRNSFVGNAASYAFGNTAGASSFTLGTSGLTYSVAGAVAPVPEPGEWLLMLSGLGLIGFIATRRKEENSMTFA